MTRYLIIGNGVAGTTAAENIRKNDATGEITIVSHEDLPFYYRVRLPDFLGGGVGESELIAKKKEWYTEKKIALRLQTRIVSADPGKKTVTTDNGLSITYDKLLLATGSHPFIPPIEGSDQEGVFAIHTIHDAREISSAAEKKDDIVLIGGGLLGLETASALHKRGKKITIIEFFPRLLPRQLDNEGAARLQQFFENMGFAFRLGATTRKLEGPGTVEKVVLDNDEVLPAEMVIISAGVRPNLELAGMLGLKTGKGVVVDRYLQTSQPGIYAAGDVIEFAEKTFGIWPAAMEQGRIAGLNISGGNNTYEGTTLSNILKVAGIDLASAGEIDADNKYESKVVATHDTYKKVVVADNRVLGCIMLGDRKNFNRINKAIATGENIIGDLDSLLKD